MNELGYTPKQIAKLFKNCYGFESRIAYLAPYNYERLDFRYLECGNKTKTLEDIEKIQGRFPFIALLENAGIAHYEIFRILESVFLIFWGSYYKERNLDKFKVYFTVHTILDALTTWMKPVRNASGYSKSHTQNRKWLPRTCQRA